MTVKRKKDEERLEAVGCLKGETGCWVARQRDDINNRMEDGLREKSWRCQLPLRGSQCRRVFSLQGGDEQQVECRFATQCCPAFQFRGCRAPYLSAGSKGGGSNVTCYLAEDAFQFSRSVD
jgi:hypothetical protein